MLRPIFAALLLALVAWWLFFTRFKLGLPSEWYQVPNARIWPLSAWGLPIAVVVIFGLGAALSVFDRFKRAKTRKEQTNSTVTALICLGVILWVWPWALLGPGAIGSQDRAGGFKLTLEGRFNVMASLWSDVATEYFGVAYQIENARDFGREYAAKWQNPTARAQAHVATHPPGAVLFFYGARRFYEGVPGVQNTFTQLASSITGQNLPQMTVALNLLRETSSISAGAPAPPPLPASAIGSALFSAMLLGLSLVVALPAVYGLAIYGAPESEREKRGLVAASLWACAPTTCLFAFTLDALVASGVIWSLFFASRAAQSQTAQGQTAQGKTATRWALASGLTLGATSFLSLGALAAWAIFVGGFWFFERKNAPRTLAKIAIGFVLFWVLASLVFAFNPVEVVQKALAAHHFATLSGRSRWAWAFWNLPMFALFLGVSTFVCLFKKPKTRNFEIGVYFGLGALLTILLLTLSGNVRGEVERLWLFLVAPLAIWAAWGLKGRESAVLIALQIGQTLLMAATLAPLVRPF